jgi:hypothetical protein
VGRRGGFFGFTRRVLHERRPMARSKPLIGLAKSGDHVTKTSTHMGNPG